jgi:nucleobase:cation symporter-1, NCS1 family
VNPNVPVPIGLTRLYYICFLTGISISAAVFLALHYAIPDKLLQDFVNSAPPAQQLMAEYRESYENLDEAFYVDATQNKVDNS